MPNPTQSTAGHHHRPPSPVAPAAVQPQWLTSVLHAGGLLPQGRARRISSCSWQHTAGGSIARCAVEYTRDALGTLPNRLLVKLPRAGRPLDLMDAVGRKEVTFYRDVAPELDSVPIPRCLAAEVGERGQWHLILEDLSETHGQTPWPIPPTDAACEVAIDALAALHAALWDDPRLDRDFGSVPTAEEIAQHIEHTHALVSRFTAFLGDRLSPARQRIYHDVVDGLPRLWQWWTRPRGRTLVHGDAHAWNLLFPRTLLNGDLNAQDDTSADARVCLIDWQNWRAGVPAFDLATFMVLDWYPERRARLEERLLRRYHDRLCALGVPNYPWEACWTDYRLAAANTLFTLPWRWDNGTEAQYWWPHLETALCAFDDLDCATLLAS